MNIPAKVNNNQTTVRDIKVKPDRQAFYSYADKHRLIPVVITHKSDTITPISIFQRLRLTSPCFLLESAEGSQKQARYSIIGRDPLIKFSARSNHIEVMIDGIDHSNDYASDPITAISKLLEDFKLPLELSTDSYRCGLTGYFAYDFVRYIENIPDNNLDETNLPDCDLIAPRQVVVYDHLRHEMTFICNVLIADNSSNAQISAKYDEAVSSLAAMRQLISSYLVRQLLKVSMSISMVSVQI